MRKSKKPKLKAPKFKAQPIKRNSKRTSVSTIVKQMNEPRPLPMGRADFEEWSDRIIAGALIQPGADEDMQDLVRAQKYALSNALLHLGPTESHKPDAHFIHSLRKFAINQVAVTIGQELKKEVMAREAAKKATEDENVTRIGAATGT